MNDITITLTPEEAQELMRTLLARIELDLKKEIDACYKTKNGKVVKVDKEHIILLAQMGKLNKSVLDKLAALNVKL